MDSDSAMNAMLKDLFWLFLAVLLCRAFRRACVGFRVHIADSSAADDA